MNPTRHLLDLYNEQLIQFDHITHAWFTSFTLEPSFVERYILPPLFGLGTPKDYRDYAQLQSEITQSDAANVRFFVDSTVNADVWNQRSISFPVHPVFMSELEGFTDAGVFHPKVILVAGSIGGSPAAILGAGSANLTVSGWGRNIEVFTLRRVEIEQQWQQVEDFWKAIGAAEFESITAPVFRDRANQKENRNWSFHHSFSQDTFLELFEGSSILHIASPYFPKDPGALLNRIHATMNEMNSSGRCSLIIHPALRNGKALIDRTQAQTIPDSDISFLIYSDPGEATFRHAKLWVTENRCAVGSWNCTEAAIGALRSSASPVYQRNVEAGFVFDTDIRNSLSDYSTKISWDDLLSDDHQPDIEEEPRGASEVFPVRVEFDWRNHRYKYSAVIPNGLPCVLSLPGISNRIELSSEGRLEIERKTALIHDKTYIVYRDGTMLFAGPVIELNAHLAPLYEYNNLESLLYDYNRRTKGSRSTDIDQSILKPILYSSDTDQDSTVQSQNRYWENTYFTMYQAFKHYRESYEQARSKGQHDFDLFMYQLPGRPEEFTSKVIAYLDEPNVLDSSTGDANTSSNSPSLLYRYLCAIELRESLKTFVQSIPTSDTQDSSSSYLRNHLNDLIFQIETTVNSSDILSIPAIRTLHAHQDDLLFLGSKGDAQ
jgi:hypothetical protein